MAANKEEQPQKASKYYPAEDVAVPKKVRLFLRHPPPEPGTHDIMMSYIEMGMGSDAPVEELHSKGEVQTVDLVQLLTVLQGPQDCPPSKASRITATRLRRYPPRWSFPRQACRSS